jgi:hypothetical protein
MPRSRGYKHSPLYEQTPCHAENADKTRNFCFAGASATRQSMPPRQNFPPSRAPDAAQRAALCGVVRC